MDDHENRESDGRYGVIVIYENLWTLDLDAVLQSHGAHLIADGRIEHMDVVAALDQTEDR